MWRSNLLGAACLCVTGLHCPAACGRGADDSARFVGPDAGRDAADVDGAESLFSGPRWAAWPSLHRRSRGTIPRLTGGFHSYSQAEIRGSLLREFGHGYEVSGVGHYLVVHPAGKRDQWAPRFEELYRSFVHYFSARGWQLTEPRFPLVAVVFPRQVDFWQQAEKDGMPRSSGVLGLLLAGDQSNFDVRRRPAAAGTGRRTPTRSFTRRPISRRSTRACTPASAIRRGGWSKGWARCSRPAACGSRGRIRTQPDRINRGRLDAWQTYAKGRRPSDAIAQIVSSDRMFSSDPIGAYAEAWALSFFLMETMPEEVHRISLENGRPAGVYRLSRSRSGCRTSPTFSARDLAMLDARMQRFMAGLK